MFRNRRGEGLGLALLGYQLFSVGTDNIPPVTLATIIAQAAAFLGFIPALHPSNTYKYCLNAGRVWWNREWWRLLPSQFMHGDDMHLYYNMVSFLWKGRRLERRLGSAYFAALLLYLAGLTSVLMVGIAYGLEEVVNVRGWGLMSQCAVGFSGVVFALKVVTNAEFPEADAMIMGWIPIPSKWACWAELGLIQLLVPNASFLGHLAGILAGLAYLHTPIRLLLHAFTTPARHSTNARRFHGRTYGTGTWGSPSGEGSDGSQRSGYYNAGSRSRGGERYEREDGDWRRYTGGLSEEEQLRRAMEESTTFRHRSNPSAPPYPPGDASGSGLGYGWRY